MAVYQVTRRLSVSDRGSGLGGGRCQGHRRPGGRRGGRHAQQAEDLLRRETETGAGPLSGTLEEQSSQWLTLTTSEIVRIRATWLGRL